MTKYLSLAEQLTGYFDKPLTMLPKPLQARVEKAFHLFPWGRCTHEQRIYRTCQYDRENDPAWETHQKYWFDLISTLHDIQREKAEWSKVAAHTATDLKVQATKLQAIAKQEAHLLAVKSRLEGRDFPRYQPPKSLYRGDSRASLMSLNSTEDLLISRIGASPEEIAAWVDIGSEAGGLDAYMDEGPAERFYFKPDMGNDYLAELYVCRFVEKDVVKFSPGERFVSGGELLENMLSSFGARARAYAIAQISEGSLSDIHPTRGVTDAGVFPQSGFPSLEEGLYSVSQIMALSKRDGWALHWPKRLDKIMEHRESPAQRRDRLVHWYDEEVSIIGKRGALKCTAEREGIAPQTLRAILDRKK